MSRTNHYVSVGGVTPALSYLSSHIKAKRIIDVLIQLYWTMELLLLQSMNYETLNLLPQL